jgi:hypothetical protein
MAEWNEELVRLEYDWEQQRGRLIMHATYADMNGCIALFQRIEPRVLVIDTFCGGRRDTSYVRSASGG